MNFREPGRYGLFEMVLVLLVISLVAGAGFRYFVKVIDEAMALSVTTEAKVFASAIGLLHWAWVTKGSNYRPASSLESAAVLIEDTVIYVNRQGWPTHTDRVLSRAALSAEGCAQVWNAIMQTPGPLTVVDGELQPLAHMQVRRVGASTCRYVRYAKTQSLHYFDYDVTSGRVTVSNGSP